MAAIFDAGDGYGPEMYAQGGAGGLVSPIGLNGTVWYPLNGFARLRDGHWQPVVETGVNGQVRAMTLFDGESRFTLTVWPPLRVSVSVDPPRLNAKATEPPIVRCGMTTKSTDARGTV